MAPPETTFTLGRWLLTSHQSPAHILGKKKKKSSAWKRMLEEHHVCNSKNWRLRVFELYPYAAIANLLLICIWRKKLKRELTLITFITATKSIAKRLHIPGHSLCRTFLASYIWVYVPHFFNFGVLRRSNLCLHFAPIFSHKIQLYAARPAPRSRQTPSSW